jgi:hypothetical protein
MYAVRHEPTRFQPCRRVRGRKNDTRFSEPGRARKKLKASLSKSGVEEHWRENVRGSHCGFCSLAADQQLGSSINAE